MGKIRRVCVFVAVLLAVSAIVPLSVYADVTVHARAHILIEMDSGRTLSQYEAHRRMFPAATTMILTAILAYEYIGLDDIIVAGNEVTMLPIGSARNFHEVGEAILGINLLRGMLIGTGNDTANIVAIEVARRVTGNENITFAQAQTFFANLMTTRAAELGALDSRFVNPHGYHHDSHFTTAYDMAQIVRHAASIPTIAEIAGQATFSGSMSGGRNDVPDDALLRIRSWRSANELLHPGDNHYSYATGLRTGRTNQAGDSLAATATRDGITFISVTFDSPILDDEPTRWRDNINLFEYGFMNFAHRTFLEENTIVGEMPVYDPRLDDPGYLEFFSTSLGMLFLSEAEMSRLVRNITFWPHFVTLSEGDNLMFAAPIPENEAIGEITYILDDEVVFTAALYSARYVPLRDTASDIDFYLARVNEIFFSAASIPYWIAAVSVLLLIAMLTILARNAIRRKRGNKTYKWK